MYPLSDQPLPILSVPQATFSATNKCEVDPMFCAGGTCMSSDPGKAICECGIGRGLDPDGIKCIGETFV